MYMSRKDKNVDEYTLKIIILTSFCIPDLGDNHFRNVIFIYNPIKIYFIFLLTYTGKKSFVVPKKKRRKRKNTQFKIVAQNWKPTQLFYLLMKMSWHKNMTFQLL